MGISRRAFHHIDSELDVMTYYVETSRSSLKDAHQQLHDRVAKRVAGMSEDEAQEVINDFAEDDIIVGDLFPAISSSWTFVSITSFIEHQLVYITRVVGEELGSSEFRPQRSVLDSCKDQMKALNLPLPTGDCAWQEMKMFQEVRNIIVHRLGEVDERKETPPGEVPEVYRDEQVCKYIGKRKDITIDYLKIVPTHEFCLHAIETGRSFLRSVVALIPKNLYDTKERER